MKILFSYCAPKERIDSPTFGHGAGMLIKPEVIEHAIDKQEAVHGTGFQDIFFSARQKTQSELLKKLYDRPLRKKTCYAFARAL